MPRRTAKVLTEISVQKVKGPATGRAEHFDALVPGLSLRVTSRGHKSWAMLYRHNGRSRRFTIGTYPAIALKDAREAARDALLRVKDGHDPAGDKAAKARSQGTIEWDAGVTFRLVAEEFVERHAKRKTKGWRETERIFRKYVNPHWADRQIQGIKRGDVTRLLDYVEDTHGPVMANRVLAAVRKSFNWHLVNFDTLESSPVVPGMARGDERKRARQRWLRDDEIVGLWRACDAVGWPHGPLVKLLLVSGQRRAEVASMRWRDVDREKGIWIIPRQFTKTDIEHEVPLPALALQVLGTVREIGEYVLTTLRRGDKPFSGFTQAKLAIVEHFEAEEHWTLHDLRRTFSTHAAKLGVQRLVISRILNHAEGGVTKVYDQHAYLDEKAHALNLWARKIESLIDPPGDKVALLHG